MIVKKYLKKSVLVITIAIFLSITWGYKSRESIPTLNEKLSDYGFFVGKISDLDPAQQVIPYDLNTPLFTDYAHKARFIYFPEGAYATYDDKDVFDFPLGTTIIKTFYYPQDFRNPEKGRTLMETRLLIKEAEGWKNLPYIWNESQTDAYLEVAGGRKDISWKDHKGKKQKLNYVIPNMNQCKGCHIKGDAITPIGPSARQLNGDFTYKEGTFNQLEYWSKKGLLKGFNNMDESPKLVNWEDEHASIDERARAYLDINCGHCHNPDGPANTSGLFLDYHTDDPAALGIQKAPIAAGRGSGGHQFDIAPGKPNESILVYRMESNDPGEMMPELGRKMAHEEGIKLIKDWISRMN